MNLFWADNDYIGPLNPLSKRLERRSFALHKVATYEEALDYIDGHDADEIGSVLLDVILPSDTKCVSYIGFEIAKDLIACGKAKKIAFLSVVLKHEVKELLDDLRHLAGNNVAIRYFDKGTLLEKNEFRTMVEFLEVKKED